MKLWNYIFLMTGISVLMALAGLEVAGISDLLKIIGVTVTTSGVTSFSIQNTLRSKIFGTTGLFAVLETTTAISAITFLYTKDKSFLMLPVMTGVTFYWISVLVSLVQIKGQFEIFGTVLAVIGIVLTVGFLQSCVDYFQGLN